MPAALAAETKVSKAELEDATSTIVPSLAALGEVGVLPGVAVVSDVGRTLGSAVVEGMTAGGSEIGVAAPGADRVGEETEGTVGFGTASVRGAGFLEESAVGPPAKAGRPISPLEATIAVSAIARLKIDGCIF
jgi:hypothetical protein